MSSVLQIKQIFFNLFITRSLDFGSYINYFFYYYHNKIANYINLLTHDAKGTL